MYSLNEAVLSVICEANTPTSSDVNKMFDRIEAQGKVIRGIKFTDTSKLEIARAEYRKLNKELDKMLAKV